MTEQERAALARELRACADIAQEQGHYWPDGERMEHMASCLDVGHYGCQRIRLVLKAREAADELAALSRASAAPTTEAVKDDTPDYDKWPCRHYWNEKPFCGYCRGEIDYDKAQRGITQPTPPPAAPSGEQASAIKVAFLAGWVARTSDVDPRLAKPSSLGWREFDAWLAAHPSPAVPPPPDPNWLTHGPCSVCNGHGGHYENCRGCQCATCRPAVPPTGEPT